MFKKHLSLLLTLLVAFSCVIASNPVFAETQSLGLLFVNNYSGVESIGGSNLVTKVTGMFKEKLKKQPSIDFSDDQKTKALLSGAGLGTYYDCANLCNSEDIMKIGTKIGLNHLAVVEINGYNEIKKENAKKNYQVLLGMRVYDCAKGEENYFSGEGLSDKNRDMALGNAVEQLINNYLQLQADDPNTGNLRANNTIVIGNIQSKMYHLQETHHSPSADNQRIFQTRSAAEDEGYRPCPICFPAYSSFFYFDRDLENSLGNEACGTIEYNYRTEYDPEALKRIEKIAAPLIADTYRKNFRYRFKLLDTDEVNAFSAPNGYIYLTTGLLNIIESDDELALVIAHEMGHLEKKHAVVRYKQALAVSLFASIFAAGVTSNNNSRNDAAALMAVVMAEIIMKGFSQEQEKEADEISLAHLKKTGMDSQAYHTLMGKFIDMRSRKIYFIEKLFGTHPTPEKRIENLDKFLQSYQALQAKL